MNEEFVVGFAREALETMLLVSAPTLVVALIVGLIVSIFQSVTQIQELTLTFIPKILAVVAVVILTFPWMIQIMTAYTSHIFESFPLLVR